MKKVCRLFLGCILLTACGQVGTEGVSRPVGGIGGNAAPAYEAGTPGPGKGQVVNQECLAYADSKVTEQQGAAVIETTLRWAEGQAPMFSLGGRVLLVMDRYQTQGLEITLAPLDPGKGSATFTLTISAEALENSGTESMLEYSRSLVFYVSLQEGYAAPQQGEWIPWASPNDYLPDGMAWLYGVCLGEMS